MPETIFERTVRIETMQQIMSANERDTYTSVVNAALLLAIAGAMVDANRVLARLWKMPWDFSSWVEHWAKAFEVLWQVTDTRPAISPFPRIPLQQLEIEARQYATIHRWLQPVSEENWRSLNATRLLAKALALAASPVEDGPLPSAEQEREALEALDRFMAERDAGWEFASALVLAAELAARSAGRESTIASA